MKLVCISNPEYYQYSLIIGKIYDVYDIHMDMNGDNPTNYLIIDENGRHVWCGQKHLMNLQKYREIKINKILET